MAEFHPLEMLLNLQTEIYGLSCFPGEDVGVGGEEPTGEVSISDEPKQSQHQHQVSSSSSIPVGPVEV